MTQRNQATITIHWPDGEWEPATEQEYLLSCLEGVKEQLEHFPLKERAQKRTFMNRFGRIYAEMSIEIVKAGE